MTRKARAIAIMLSIVSFSALTVPAILAANAWLNAGPNVDMRL